MSAFWPVFLQLFLELVDLRAEPLHLALDRALALLAMAKLGDLLLAFPSQIPRFGAKPGREVRRVIDHAMAGRAQPALCLLRLLLRVPRGGFEIPFGGLGIEVQALGRIPYLVGDAVPCLGRCGSHLFPLLLGRLGRLLRLPLRVRNGVLGARRDLLARGYALILLVAGQRDQECRCRGAADREQNHFTVEVVVMLLHEVHPFPAGRVTAPGLLLPADNRSAPLYPDVPGCPRGGPQPLRSLCGPDHTSASLPIAVVRAALRIRGMECRADLRDWLCRLPVRRWTIASSVMLPDLLSSDGGTITFLFVVEVPQSMPLDAELPTDSRHRRASLAPRRERGSASASLRNTDIVTELLQARAVGPAIVDEAIERDADAIVMTAAIHRRHGRPTLGETTDHVLLNAPCEVVVIRTVPDPAASVWNAADESRHHGLRTCRSPDRRPARPLRATRSTVIDTDSRAFRRLPAGFGGETVIGTGIDEDVLRKAGIEDAQTPSSRSRTATTETSWRRRWRGSSSRCLRSSAASTTRCGRTPTGASG